jgi:ABC-2 type transport system permease protein
MKALTEILARREMLNSLIARDLKSRYKSSALGFLWSIITPLFMAATYVFFLRLLARGIPIGEVIIGVFAWTFTVQNITAGMDCITANTNLVKKVAFPRTILPLATTLANLIGYLLSLIVQFVLLAIILRMSGQSMSLLSFAIPVVIVFHTLFNLAITFLVSSSNVYFRDTQHLVGVGLSAWFFVSPVMYSLGLVEQFAGSDSLLIKLYMLNPLAIICTGYRALILPGVSFPWHAYSIAGIVGSVALLFISYLVFKKAQANFADML